MSDQELAQLVKTHCDVCELHWCSDCGMRDFKAKLFKRNIPVEV